MEWTGSSVREDTGVGGTERGRRPSGVPPTLVAEAEVPVTSALNPEVLERPVLTTSLARRVSVAARRALATSLARRVRVAAASSAEPHEPDAPARERMGTNCHDRTNHRILCQEQVHRPHLHAGGGGGRCS